MKAILGTNGPGAESSWGRNLGHRVKPVAAALVAAGVLAAAAKGADEDIRLNTVGYVPERAKVASVLADGPSGFVIKRAEDGSVAYSGELGAARENSDTEETIRLAEFSELEREGVYYLELDDGSRSPEFRIAADVYNESLRVNLLGFLGQRCGQSVSFEHGGHAFSHESCHLDDGYLDFFSGQSGHKNGVGGWHDAGDYGKYIVNSGFTVGMMLQAWEHFEDTLKSYDLPDLPQAERENAIPDYLDEVKYNLDWVLKMQFPDGRVSHKLTRQQFAPFIMPSEDDAKRYFSPWSTAATADFVAMTAMAARVYEPYDPKFAEQCREAAWLSYGRLQKHPESLRADLSEFSTGPYQTDDPDERLWAAAELWATTGDAQVHDDFRERAKSYEDKAELDWDWGDKRNLAMFTYALIERKGKDEALLKEIQADIVSVADALVANHDDHGYGRAVPRYYWGANGTVVRASVALNVANALEPNSQYLDVAANQLAYVYGRNNYGRSFVTGEGYRPPMHPHHRPSGADDIAAPWPGHLVGGGHPGAMAWLDEQGSFATNENAINWDGAMAYALAMFATAEEGQR